MSSIRAAPAGLAASALLALAAAAMAAITYRNVLGETEALFDYQLQQMALSLRDQGEIASGAGGHARRRAARLRDPDLDRRRPQHLRVARARVAAGAGAARPGRRSTSTGRAWRTYSVATRERVIQVAQPVEIRQRLAAHAAWRSVLPLLLMTPFAALAIWWLAAQNLAPLDRLAARGALARRALARAGADERPARRGRAAGERAQRACSSGCGSSLDSAARVRRRRGARAALAADRAEAAAASCCAAPTTTRRAKRRVAALGAGIDRAARLVEQLLTLARSEPGAAPARPSRVDLGEVAREALGRCDRVRRRRAAASSRSTPTRRCVVHGDAGGARGCSRATWSTTRSRYSPPRLARRRRACAATAARPCCEVDDAGPGIPAERARARLRPLLSPRRRGARRAAASAWRSCAASPTRTARRVALGRLARSAACASTRALRRRRPRRRAAPRRRSAVDAPLNARLTDGSNRRVLSSSDRAEASARPLKEARHEAESLERRAARRRCRRRRHRRRVRSDAALVQARRAARCRRPGRAASRAGRARRPGGAAEHGRRPGAELPRHRQAVGARGRRRHRRGHAQGVASKSRACRPASRTIRSSSSSAACPAWPARPPEPAMPFRGMGSGFIISSDGLILTNAHVVRDAKDVTVKLTDRREYTAKVLGIDTATDIAVLRIDAKDLPVVRLGDPKNLEVGDPVLAIGAPYGLEQTATLGHRQRQGALAAGRRGRALHPDRRGGESRQLGRPAVRRQRLGGRHQLADLLAQRRLPGRVVRDPDQRRAEGQGPDRRHRQGAARPPRRDGAGPEPVARRFVRPEARRRRARLQRRARQRGRGGGAEVGRRDHRGQRRAGAPLGRRCRA